MGELDLIRSFVAGIGQRGGRVVRGPGDDAAVVRADGATAVTIDTVVDGVHFRRTTHSPADIGHKALARGLSDIAAMGAAPGEAYVALGLPDDFPADDARELVAAMESLAERCGVTIAGGDVTGSPVLFVTVSATGWADSADAMVGRDGAKPGDLVGVTGELGGSEAGRKLLEDPPSAPLPSAPLPSAALLSARHRRPEPRIDAGRALARAGVRAMIDVSDGVATDARHIAESSGVAMEIRLAGLPLPPGGTDPFLAATGGDDYELLFTCAPDRRAAVDAAVPDVTWIGDVREGSGLELVDAAGRAVAVAGFEHL